MNMDTIIEAHNAKILKKEEESSKNGERSCNYRDKAGCPVTNNFLESNVVNKVTVQHDGNTQHYIGMTENTF